jgi:hypothetical protein
LAKEIELEGLHLGEDGYIWLVTASGLHIHFQQEDESLLSICELGRLTTDEGRMEMLETLLAANALWEGTKGATLSLEPTSDKMLPARKRTINELEETASKGLLKTMLKWCTIGQNSLLSPSPNPLEARVRWKVAD